MYFEVLPKFLKNFETEFSLKMNIYNLRNKIEV